MSRKGWSHERANNETVEWYTPPEIFEALGTIGWLRQPKPWERPIKARERRVWKYRWQQLIEVLSAL